MSHHTVTGTSIFCRYWPSIPLSSFKKRKKTNEDRVERDMYEAD